MRGIAASRLPNEGPPRRDEVSAVHNAVNAALRPSRAMAPPYCWRSLRSRGPVAPQATPSLVATLLSPDAARHRLCCRRSLRSRWPVAPQATSSLVATLLSPDAAPPVPLLALAPLHRPV